MELKSLVKTLSIKKTLSPVTQQLSIANTCKQRKSWGFLGQRAGLHSLNLIEQIWELPKLMINQNARTTQSEFVGTSPTNLG